MCGFDEDEIQFIILAVDEACANVIRHAYNNRTDGPIALACTTSDNRIEFRLLDHGKSAVEQDLKSRSLDEVRPGGLGMHLIRSIMDEVHYDSGGDGNKLILAKSMRPRPRVQTGAATE